MSDEPEFWVPTGTRVRVDPVHAFRAGRHPDHMYTDDEPYEGVVIGSRGDTYHIVDDDGIQREAPSTWLRLVSTE